MSRADSDYVFKILVLGEGGTGKTSLLFRYMDNTFTDGAVQPPGEDFRARQILVGDKKVLLEIWDTQGQERFRTVTSSYYRGASGMLVVYDVTNPTSFEKIAQWADDVDRYSTVSSSKMLVANKIDLADQRQITEAQGQALAAELKLTLMETSAKTGANVERLFNELAASCVVKENPTAPRPIVGLPPVTAPEKKKKHHFDCAVL